MNKVKYISNICNKQHLQTHIDQNTCANRTCRVCNHTYKTNKIYNIHLNTIKHKLNL